REALRRDLERGLRHLHLERREPPLLSPGRPDRLHGEERRAIAQEARVVLVARGLMDLGLPAELRLHRLDAQAVRLLPAVTAALAHALVDVDAHGRVQELATLA